MATTNAMAQFTRTVCACKACSTHCHTQPGPLGPGDRERIARYLGISFDTLDERLVASAGATVGDRKTGKLFQIGTVTPGRQANGACTFLTPDGKCSIHPVAPAGCAYFDAHMPTKQAESRSIALHYSIHVDADYRGHRLWLAMRDDIGDL